MRALLLPLALLAAAPAGASATLSCEGEETALRMTLGSGPAFQVLSARIEVEDHRLTTEDLPGFERIAIGGASDALGLTAIELVNVAGTEVSGSVFLVSATEGRAVATAGVLRLKDRGAWPVVCEGP